MRLERERGEEASRSAGKVVAWTGSEGSKPAGISSTCETALAWPLTYRTWHRIGAGFEALRHKALRL
jgi:hypothetical protein